jgi:hypothetical protein
VIGHLSVSDHGLLAQEQFKHKAHFWCKCGGPVGKPSAKESALVKVPAGQCQSLQYEGSCTNGIKVRRPHTSTLHS